MKPTILALALELAIIVPAIAQDALPSWNDTAPKRAIVAFVEKVTKSGSPDFVPPAERIATFDNDGCLWAEQPMYFQARIESTGAPFPSSTPTYKSTPS